MTATRRVKVRCAGLPVVTRGREDPTDYDELPSCGWSGERAAGPGATRRPCKQCGGRVELVGRTPDPTLELVDQARTKPLYPELGEDLKRAGEQAARHKADLP